MSIETIHLSHLPADMPIYAALYQNVTNVGFLREQLLAGNEKFEYAFIDAGMILSRHHALAAVFRAVLDYLNDRLKSRNVHSEIVFSLSSNNNIGEAFRRFGITDTTKSLLVFKVGTTPSITAESVTGHLTENVKGTAVPVDDDHIAPLTDLARLKKVHKLGSMPGAAGLPIRKKGGVGNSNNGDAGGELDGGDGGEVDERKVIETQVLGLMALRGSA